MDALQIVQLIIGVILIFFLSGFFILRVFYKHMHIKSIEFWMLCIGISIGVTILLGMILGVLGIFSFLSSIIAYIIFFLGLGAYYFYNKRRS